MESYIKQLIRIEKKLKQQGIVLALFCFKHNLPVVLTQFGWVCQKCVSEVYEKKEAE